MSSKKDFLSAPVFYVKLPTSVSLEAFLLSVSYFIHMYVCIPYLACITVV